VSPAPERDQSHRSRSAAPPPRLTASGARDAGLFQYRRHRNDQAKWATQRGPLKGQHREQHADLTSAAADRAASHQWGRRPRPPPGSWRLTPNRHNRIGAGVLGKLCRTCRTGGGRAPGGADSARVQASPAILRGGGTLAHRQRGTGQGTNTKSRSRHRQEARWMDRGHGAMETPTDTALSIPGYAVRPRDEG